MFAAVFVVSGLTLGVSAIAAGVEAMAVGYGILLAIGILAPAGRYRGKGMVDVTR